MRVGRSAAVTVREFGGVMVLYGLHIDPWLSNKEAEKLSYCTRFSWPPYDVHAILGVVATVCLPQRGFAVENLPIDR